MGRSPWSALRTFVFVTAGVFCVPGSVLAADHRVEILLDLDGDATTGCAVATIDGPFAGVEQILVTVVETTSPPPAGTVTDVAVAECIDPSTDTFGSAASFDGGWAVGIAQGEGGVDAIETYYPLLFSVVPDSTLARVALVVTDELGAQSALLTRDGTPGGPPILIALVAAGVVEIPTLGSWGLILLALLLAGGSIVLLRHRGAGAAVVALLLAGSLAWAAPGVAGAIGDWLLQHRLAGDDMVLWAKKVDDRLSFRVDVDLRFDAAPAITSANATTFTAGSAGSFTVTADGLPAPAFTIGGEPLPAGVSFDTTSGVLSGTPHAGTGGTYGLSFTATNAVGSSSAQTFTLAVHEGPSFISATSASFAIRFAESFTIVTDGFPAAALTLGGDPLPGTLGFTDNGDGTAILAGTPGAADLGTYDLTFTAGNGVGAPVVQSFTLGVLPFASYADFVLDPGHSSVIGIAAIGASLYVFTTDEIYTLPLTATSGPFTELQLSPQTVGVRLNTSSWAIPSPVDPNVVFYPGGMGALERLYTYRLAPEAQTSVAIDQLDGRPTGLAVEASTGAVFFSRPSSAGAGVSKLPSASTGTPTLTFGSSGPGTLTAPGALAFGPDGLLYVLDTGVNRVFSFDSAGVYRDDFPLVGTAANTLAIDSTGRLFTMTGAGGGEIYDAVTGSFLGAFTPTSVGGPSPGKPLLTVAGDTLYAFDDTTGLHAYDLSSL